MAKRKKATEGKNLIGVDIGSSSIKLCELTETRSGETALVRFETYALPAQTVVDGHIMDTGSVVSGLKHLFRKTKRRDVAMRAGGHSVIIKKLSLPLMTPQELQEQINWEAEQHIPFSLSEVNIDYQVLRRRPEHGQMDLLLVAAKREEMSDIVNLATEAGLKPRIVDLDAFAVQNVFEQSYGAPKETDPPVALIHIGASTTTINVLHQGISAFTRDLNRGGEAITSRLQKELNLSREQAEEHKKHSPDSRSMPKDAPAVIDSVTDEIAGEVQRSLDFFLATSGQQNISTIYLSGGSALSPSLRNSIAKRSETSVAVLDPLKGITTDASKFDIASLSEQASQLCVALGLALRKEKERPL